MYCGYYYTAFRYFRELDYDFDNMVFIARKLGDTKSKDPYKPMTKYFEIDRRQKIHCIRNNC